MTEKILAIWRLFWALVFYPIALGFLIWLWVKDAHWLWGLAVIAAILIFDPIWGLVAKRILSWRPAKDD